MSTENERLRALLAEAREFVALSHDEGADRKCRRGECLHFPLLDRIDAALAEPVARCGECYGGLTEARPGRHQCDTCETGRVVADLKRERDEARAEVARLVYEAGATIASATVRTYSDGWRAGAEAMREAAASECWALSDELARVPDTLGEQQAARSVATRIRALPIPEGK